MFTREYTCDGPDCVICRGASQTLLLSIPEHWGPLKAERKRFCSPVCCAEWIVKHYKVSPTALVASTIREIKTERGR